MEIDLRSIVLFLAKQEKTPQDIHKEIVDTFKYEVIAKATVSKYLRMARCTQSNFPMKKKGEFPIEDKNQIIVKHALELYPFSSVREIAKVTHIPKSTVFHLNRTTSLYFEAFKMDHSFFKFFTINSKGNSIK